MKEIQRSNRRSDKSNWILTPDRFLTPAEVKKFSQVCDEDEALARRKGRQEPVRNAMVIDMALNTGLRVSELSRLMIRDLFLEEGKCSLVVTNGKGGKRRLVRFSESTKAKIISFLDYRVSDSPYLFPSQRGELMTRAAIWKVFKKLALKAGLPARHTVHSLRHTHATNLYRVSGHNLRMVQKQLGHSSISTTTVYSDVMEEEIFDALEKL